MSASNPFSVVESRDDIISSTRSSEKAALVNLITPASSKDSLLTQKYPDFNLSFYTFIMNEMIIYSQKQVSEIAQLEQRLKNLGKEVGLRAFELMNWRESQNSSPFGPSKRELEREISIIGALAFVSNNLWKFLFGKCADSLEKNTENDFEYMIWENVPLYLKYTSIPKEMGTFTPASFTAGIIEVVLASSNLKCTVSAHNYPQHPHLPLRTVYLIKMHQSAE